jgi:hypothetical protein
VHAKEDQLTEEMPPLDLTSTVTLANATVPFHVLTLGRAAVALGDVNQKRLSRSHICG